MKVEYSQIQLRDETPELPLNGLDTAFLQSSYNNKNNFIPTGAFPK